MLALWHTRPTTSKRNKRAVVGSVRRTHYLGHTPCDGTPVVSHPRALETPVRRCLHPHRRARHVATVTVHLASVHACDECRCSTRHDGMLVFRTHHADHVEPTAHNCTSQENMHVDVKLTNPATSDTHAVQTTYAVPLDPASCILCPSRAASG